MSDTATYYKNSVGGWSGYKEVETPVSRQSYREKRRILKRLEEEKRRKEEQRWRIYWEEKKKLKRSERS